MINTTLKNIVVFASGNGSNFRTIHSAICHDKISAKISMLISNNPDCGAVCYANENGIDVKIINYRNSPNSKNIVKNLARWLVLDKVDLILLLGYLKKIPSLIINRFNRKILNIHPSLLPDFGGKGFYGNNVHRAVIQSKVKITGATVHFVNNEYDKGPILIQESIDVLKDDDINSLSKRVLEKEHEIIFEAVKNFCENRIKWLNGLPIII